MLAFCRALLGSQPEPISRPLWDCGRNPSRARTWFYSMNGSAPVGHVALPFFLLLGRHRDLLRSEVEDRSTLNSEVERRFVSIRNQRGGGGRKREEGKH